MLAIIVWVISLSDSFNAPLGGLNLTPNQLVVGQQFLHDCNNIVCDREGILESRRGFENFNNSLTNSIKLFSFDDKILVHDDIELKKDNSGTWSSIIFPDTNSINTPDSETKIQSVNVSKNFYFNGKRISSETGNPTDYLIKKLSSLSGNVCNSGLEQPINCNYSLTNGSLLPNGNSLAIRVFYIYSDSNKNQIISPPSDRIVVINNTGSSKNISIIYQISKQFNDNLVDVYYAISNQISNPATPSDFMFWGEQTRMNSQIQINNGSIFEFGNIINKENIINPIELYTNATQEGITQENSPPVKCVSMEVYQGYTFYANLTNRLIQRVLAREFPISTDIITIDGVTFRRGSSNDFSANPSIFGGTNVEDYTINLCRAITNRSTKYRAIYESNNNSLNIGKWINKTNVPNDADENHTVSTVNNNDIWVFPTGNTLDNILSKYNVLTNIWQFISNAPNNNSFNTIQYYNNKIYVLVGDKGSNIIGDTQIYNITTNSWSTGTVFPYTSNRYIYSVSNIYLDKIYIIGGVQGSTIVDSVSIYNITSNTWSTGTSMPNPTFAGSSVVVGAFIYYFGGFDATDTVTNLAYKYDIINDSWSSIANIPYAVASLGTAYYDGIIYLVNGNTGTFIPPPSPTSLVLSYNIANNSYLNILNTNYLRYGNSAQIIDGTLYTFGGSTFSDPAESFKIDGVFLQFQERFISDYTSIPYTSSFISNANFANASYSLIRDSFPNQIAYSKQGEPEAVPVLNNIFLPSRDMIITKIKALRGSLIIFSTLGAYALNGNTSDNFTLQQLDPTLILQASESVAYLDNQIFGLSTKGIFNLTESGAQYPTISYPVKIALDPDVNSVSLKNYNINGAANEFESRYILSINDKTYQYNIITQKWTFWDKGIADISSWIVKDGITYKSRSTQVLKQRKSFANSDYQDESGGILCSMEFVGNQLNNFGTLKILRSFVLNQFGISGLNIDVLLTTNFVPISTLFTILFDQEYKRFLPRIEQMRAIEYDLKLSWSTQKNDFTFSNFALQGIDYTYDLSGINIR